MFKALTNASVRLVSRYLPDPFLFAVVLTLIVFVFGMFLGNTPVDMVQYWGDGFWNLLAFSMQMVLILVTGHTLANSPFFKNVLSGIASTAKTPAKAIVLTTVLAALASWINWGFGLVIGALLAKEVAKKVEGVDYRLLVASAYSGFLVWHAGFSGSIPLTVATPDHFSQDMIGVISTNDTIFSTFNIMIVLALIVIIPFINRMMMPDKGDEVVFQQHAAETELSATAEAAQPSETPADKMENSYVLPILISMIGFSFIIYYFATNGFQLNLNIVNLMFLFFGILLHRTPRRFLNAIRDAVKGTSGIIIQFPFYAGIMGMMVASGLANSMSQWFVTISNDVMFPFFTFLSAGIVNFFVPSGGGQWAVQAPVVLQASSELGVSLPKTIMAVAWGDAWTNMIQPFWALPALGIAGLGARDIMGYCLIVLIFSGAIISLGLLFL